MAAGAVGPHSVRAPTRVPGLASTALRDVLGRRRLPGIVLGTSTHAAWVLAGSEVVVITSRDATRLPNGVELPSDAAGGVLRDVNHGASATIETNSIILDGLVVDIARWWDPRPVVGLADRRQLSGTVEGLPATVPSVDEQLLERALVERSPDALVAAGEMMIGRGPGLTPESDDYLAGAVAALRVFGDALEDEAATGMLDVATEPLEGIANVRTTTLSASLLRCAMRGEVAEPATRLIRAIAGRGSVGEGYEALRSVGDTSGPALAAGVVLGVRALVAGAPLS